MTTRELVLYERAECHLCREMHAELIPWQQRLGFSLRLVDIDASAALVERYGHKVPVLVDGEVEICHYFLDEDMLREHFGTPP